MRIIVRFHILVLLTVLLVFSISFEPLAQQNVLAEAVTDAERDAQQYTNLGSWFLMGCFGKFPVPALGSNEGIDDNISLPPTRLLGKSPEYISIYAAAYSEKVKKIRTNSMRSGCLLGGVSCIAICAGGIIIISGD
jgi:hypothetical protein